MMRVDRNDIWGNLQQIKTGLTNGVFNALITSNRQPNSFLFGLLEDPTDAEKEASAHNKIQLENIQDNIKSTQSVLEDKLEDLNGFYDKKVKPFENTDDDYKGLASNVKKKYTSFFEGIKEVLDTIDQIALDIVKGFVNGLIGMVTGLVTIALDVGIVAVSGLIPDPIEPAFLKKKADETFDGYKDAAIQLIQDPISVVELVAQSVSDTVEQEGIAYVTGEVLTAFVPAAGAVKLVKGASKLKGPAKTKVSNSSYSKEFIQGKIDTAKAGLADVKVPSFTRERLSTGISDIPTVRVEWKKLSETHPQMFAVKGDGSTKGTGKAGQKTSTENGITKGEYKNLRKKTPSNEIRKMVNPDGPKVDPVYGYKVDKFEADHIVSMKKVTEMDGFSRLTIEQQIEVLNLKDNFSGLGKSTNASKGANSWADWKGHSKMGEVPVNVRIQMIEREKQAREGLKLAIEERLK